MFFRKKPLVVNAIQYNEENLNDIIDFAGNDASFWFSDISRLFIKYDGAMHVVFPGDYVVRESKDMIYVVREHEFNRTHEKIVKEKTFNVIVSKDINQVFIETESGKEIVCCQMRYVKLERMLHFLTKLLDGLKVKYQLIVEE